MMMKSRILLTGPPGGGKSVIVRQVMSLHDSITANYGGVGGLPLSYTCRRFGDNTSLQVLGNYEKTSRDRHGLAQFNRYTTDFTKVLRHGLEVNTTSAVLCEGGFLHPKRLDSDIGKKFSEGCIVIWLAPPDARESLIFRRGCDLGDASYDKSCDAAFRTMLKMTTLGAKCRVIEDREKALRTVCSEINPMLDYERVAPHVQNKR